jgi:hypothetical protein
MLHFAGSKVSNNNNNNSNNIKKKKMMIMIKKKAAGKEEEAKGRGEEEGRKGKARREEDEEENQATFHTEIFSSHSQYGKKVLWHVQMFCSATCNNYSSGPSFMTLKGTGGQKFGLDDLL